MVGGQVVDMVISSGSSVTFYTLDEDSYKKAKAQGVDLANPQKTPAENNSVGADAPKAKLCYLVNSISGFGFSLSTTEGELHRCTKGSNIHVLKHCTVSKFIII